MATAATADKKGMKRICPGCSTRFYDFNKRPIVCPNCKIEFTGEVKVKIRRSRAVAAETVEDQTDDTPVADKDEDDALLENDDVVSLDEVDEDEVEDEDEDVTDPDLDMDEDDLDDDDFDDEDDLDDDEDDEDEDEDEDDEDDAPKKKPGKKR